MELAREQNAIRWSGRASALRARVHKLLGVGERWGLPLCRARATPPSAAAADTRQIRGVVAPAAPPVACHRRVSRAASRVPARETSEVGSSSWPGIQRAPHAELIAARNRGAVRGARDACTRELTARPNRSPLLAGHRHSRRLTIGDARLLRLGRRQHRHRRKLNHLDCDATRGCRRERFRLSKVDGRQSRLGGSRRTASRRRPVRAAATACASAARPRASYDAVFFTPPFRFCQERRSNSC